MAHGGTLTINPQTGLPEAGFLDSLLPTLLGGAATYLTGGAITPMMAAMGVGGLTALTSKDLGKGLMAGLGAYGGSGIMEGLAGFGTGALSAEAGGAAINAAGVDPLSFEADQIALNAMAAPKIANASYYDKIAAGASKAMSEPMNALSAIGGGSKLKGAAMLGAPLLSALSTQEATPAPTFQQTQFDPRAANINIRREQRPYQPDTGSSAQRDYFGSTYIDQYGADGGFVADGGIQHFASGGIPLDPNYDYSGYGRKNTTRPVPVVQPKALAKPDFVGADGKTYRYDPAKKSWYVFKDAPAKTNPGVAVLMGDQGGEGGAGEFGGQKGTPDYAPAAALGRTLSNMGLTTAGGYLSQQAQNGFTGQTIEGLQKDPETGLAPGELAGSPQQSSLSNSAQTQTQTAAAPAAAPAAPTGIATLGSQAAQIEADAAQAERAAIADARAATEKTFDPFAKENTVGLDQLEQAVAAADKAEAGKAARDAALNGPTGIAALVDAPAPAPAPIGPNAPVGGPTVTGVEDAAGTPVGPSSVTGTALEALGALGAPGMNTGTTGGTPEQAGDIGNPGGPNVDVNGPTAGVNTNAGEGGVGGPSGPGGVGSSAGPQGAGVDTNAGEGGVGGVGGGSGVGGTGGGAGVDTNAGEGGVGGVGGGSGVGGTGGGAGSESGDGGGGDGDGGGDGGGGGDWAYGGMIGRYAQGGLGSLGGYSDGGRLLRGPGDGVSDHIPATIGRTRQPARLADGEFVVPARIVSELGNGSTEAGARALYKMMDRIQANRRKTTGKNSVAVDSKAHKYLPA
jgi:hypothetical protein